MRIIYIEMTRNCVFLLPPLPNLPTPTSRLDQDTTTGAAKCEALSLDGGGLRVQEQQNNRAKQHKNTNESLVKKYGRKKKS